MVKIILSRIVMQICFIKFHYTVSCSGYQYADHSGSKKSSYYTCSHGHAQNYTVNCPPVLPNGTES